MNNFKEQLAERLSNAVKSQTKEAELILFSESDEGFYCDYAMPPLNPKIFSAIAQKLDISGINCVCTLQSFSGVYRDNDAEKPMLQRIYAAAFKTEAELEVYQRFVAEAQKRDHKTIGHELKLFSASNEIGQGLVLWHPKGAMLRRLVQGFAESAHILNDYEMVLSPHIGKSDLWKRSGHLDFYKDSMYSPIQIEDEEYYLKPMNCPFHFNIYNSEIHSYRDLPVKYAEYGTVYRYELSGALNGLTRVRGFTQDDAHIICTPEQVEAEVISALRFSLYILRAFGLDQFEPYISTKPPRKSIGDDHDWEMATKVLIKAVESVGLSYQIDAGGGAFYGPKIDIKLRDSLNREWQCSTVQFDFNLPGRFDMSYVGKDGKQHRPYLVHRALFGSLERFIALLIEHYGGDFPFWFAPLQLGIVPIKEHHNAYCKKLLRALKANGLRAKVNLDNSNMRSKIKQFQLEKVPFILVVGDKETEANAFAVRSRKDGDLGVMDIKALMEHLKPLLEQGTPRCILEEDF